MFKRILGYFKKPSPIKDEINRRDQHLRGNVMSTTSSNKKIIYDHGWVRKLHDHLQSAYKSNKRKMPEISDDIRIALACDISEWVLEEYGPHITEEKLIEKNPDDDGTQYTEEGQDIFENIYEEIETRILRYFKVAS